MTETINYLRRCAGRKLLEASLAPEMCRGLVQMIDRLEAERDAALAEVDRITEAGRAHIRRAAAFEAQEPVAWAGESPERSDGCGACGDSCRSRGSCRLADESPMPADPLTPPPGCRLLGDNEPAQAGDMAYIGSIGGRWRPVRQRMGIIGATMDELSDGARVLALARPCRCGPDGGAA